MAGACSITISQNFYYAGLALTSSTFASTMNNLQPAVTFLLAYILRYAQHLLLRQQEHLRASTSMILHG